MGPRHCTFDGLKAAPTQAALHNEANLDEEGRQWEEGVGLGERRGEGVGGKSRTRWEETDRKNAG